MHQSRPTLHFHPSKQFLRGKRTQTPSMVIQSITLIFGSLTPQTRDPSVSQVFLLTNKAMAVSRPELSKLIFGSRQLMCQPSYLPGKNSASAQNVACDLISQLRIP